MSESAVFKEFKNKYKINLCPLIFRVISHGEYWPTQFWPPGGVTEQIKNPHHVLYEGANV